MYSSLFRVDFLSIRKIYHFFLDFRTSLVVYLSCRNTFNMKFNSTESGLHLSTFAGLCVSTSSLVGA